MDQLVVYCRKRHGVHSLKHTVDAKVGWGRFLVVPIWLFVVLSFVQSGSGSESFLLFIPYMMIPRVRRTLGPLPLTRRISRFSLAWKGWIVLTTSTKQLKSELVLLHHKSVWYCLNDISPNIKIDLRPVCRPRLSLFRER